MFSSIVGRTLMVLLSVLFVCFFTLLMVSNYTLTARQMAAFETASATTTGFVAGQINTGTRLKREAMIAPQIDALFAEDSLAIASLRVTHIEGIAVSDRTAETAPSDVAGLHAAPNFESDASAVWQDQFLVVRAPIDLGAGADQVRVGELSIVWNAQSMHAAIQNESIKSAWRYLLTMLLAAGAMVFILRRFVSRPVNSVAAALSKVADGELDTPIPAASTREINSITNALTVFVGKQREAVVAAEAAEAARLQEQKQLAEAEAFQKELEGVMAPASHGDFSGRLAAHQQGGYGDMAKAINAMMDSVQAGLAETRGFLEALAVADLTRPMKGALEGEFLHLKSDADRTLSALSDLLANISSASAGTLKDADEVSDVAVELSERATRQAASLEETAATMEELSRTVSMNTDNLLKANSLSSDVAGQTTEGLTAVQRAVEAVGEIDDRSRKVAEIISVIEAIAVQTNLLALNAAVEAARAGEHGRGFAIVADEVRTLAQRSSDAASDVTTLVNLSVASVENGVSLVNATGDTLKQISEATSKLTEAIETTTVAAKEQASGVQSINGVISNIDNATQENAKLSGRAAAAAQRLKVGAGDLNGEVQQFKVSTRMAPTANNSPTAENTSISQRSAEIVPPETVVKPEQVEPMEADMPFAAAVGDSWSTF